MVKGGGEEGGVKWMVGSSLKFAFALNVHSKSAL